MARARNIKPGLYKNEDLAECSVWARYLFPGLWMLADREGRLEDRPKRIKGELLPFDAQDVDPLLRELEGRGFIVRYKINGCSYIQITKFREHQTPHYSEKQSVIKPPEFQEKAHTSSPKNSKKPPIINGGAQPPDSLIPDSHDSHDSPNPSSTTAATAAEPEGFAEFRLIYPRRAGNNPLGRALKAWRARCAEGHIATEFVDGGKRYAAFIRSVGKEGTEFVLQAATFLGPDKPFLQDWAKPSAGQEIDMEKFIRELEEKERARASH